MKVRRFITSVEWVKDAVMYSFQEMFRPTAIKQKSTLRFATRFVVFPNTTLNWKRLLGPQFQNYIDVLNI
jgi:hypothetical protein